MPDGQGQVSSPLVLGDHGAETGSEFVSPPWLALGQKFPVDLGPSGDHSVVSSPLHNPVSSGLSEVICVSGSLEGPEGLPGPPEVSHHDEIVEIVDELDLDPVATEKLVIAPFHKNQHRDLPSETPGETYSCRSVLLNSTGNLMVPISINGVFVNAVIDTAAQVTVLSTDFVHAYLPSLQFSGVYDLNGIKNGAPVTATLSEDLIIGIGDQSFRWRALKADITDHCILGLDFIAKFQLDIKLSENTLTVGDCAIPVHLSNGHKARAHTVNTVALSSRVKIKPHSGVNFSLRLNSKFRSDADLAVFEPVCHPQVDILSVISVPDEDLPITILNNTGQTVTLRRGFVLGVLADVAECDVSSPDFQRPQFEVRTLYAHQFRDCFPAVRSDNFGKIQGTLPSHLQDLFRRSCTHITLYQAVMLANLLTEYASVFSRHDTDLGHLKGIYHRIVTIDDTPVKHHMRRTPFHFEKEEEENLNKMKRAGVVVDSCSEYASPVCLVRKKDGSVRWTIDLRSLNKRTVKDCFPLPKIEQCLDTLQGNQYFSTLDCASGYWQIEIHPEDQKKTAFITKYGLFEHRMMAFGLCNAAATFQRAMQFVLSGLLWKKCLCYIDDVHVLGTDFESALNNLSEIFERFKIHNLKMRPKKCILLQPEVVYLGRLVGRDGVTIRQEHVQVIKDWPVPKTKQELQSFLGFTNYHREYIKDYAIVTENLYKVAASSKSGPINLTQSHIDAIELLRECICNAPVFPYPSTEHTFLLDCDASDTAIGCELLQLVDGKEHIIAFGSFALTPPQRRYCTTRKELLAVLRFTREFRHYLLGRPFVVRTDHNSLTWLMSFKNIEGQLARWMEELSQFDMSVVHRPGKYHINADALSRIPDPLVYCPNYRAGTMLSRLPCYSQLNPCKFCTRAEETWTHFQEDVDYVVPLTVRKIEVKDFNEPITDVVQFGLPQYTQEELRQAQADDVDLGVIIKWLESEDLPSQLDLSLSSPAVRHYWLMRDQIVFCHNVMFYRWEDYSTTRYLLIVPYVLREEVLRMNHDVRDAGHTGQVNTFNRVRHAFYWFRMRSDIYTYVKTCAKCNTNKKPRRRRRAELGQYHAGAPMDRVMMDILGPLSKTPRGNTVILMLIDQFTKWIECYPLPDQSAEVVAKAVVEDFFSRFGVPREIHTDQGRNFVSNLFTSLCSLLQIRKTQTTGYRPCSNGQIERMNRQVLQMLRCLREKNIRDWDTSLSQIAGAIRSTVNRSTGFTPNKLMLGREVNKPVDVLFGVNRANTTLLTPPEYVAHVDKTIKASHEAARENLGASILYNKRDYDIRAYQTSYDVGDLVYVLDPSNKPGVSTKLQPIYRGPYLVIKVYSPILYGIKDRKRQLVVHHDRLLLCADRFIPLWMRKLRNEFLSLDETIPYDEAELEDLNQFHSEAEEDIQGLFKLPNIPTNLETDITPTPSPTPTPTNEELNIVDDVPAAEASSDSDAVVEEGDTDEISQANVEWTRRGRRIVRPSHLRDFILGDHD